MRREGGSRVAIVVRGVYNGVVWFLTVIGSGMGIGICCIFMEDSVVEAGWGDLVYWFRKALDRSTESML